MSLLFLALIAAVLRGFYAGSHRGDRECLLSHGMYEIALKNHGWDESAGAGQELLTMDERRVREAESIAFQACT